MTSARSQSSTHSAERAFALEGGLPASLAIGLGLVLVIEGAVLHVWVAERSRTWAWGITAINVLTMVWLWREHASSRRARVIVRENDVVIDAGSRLQCRFPRSAIASAEAATWRSVPDMATDFANTAKPLEPNIVVTLHDPIDAKLALGITKRVRRVGLRVADADALMALFAGSG